MTEEQTLTNTTALNLLYLDDMQNALDSFSKQVGRFNKNPQSFDIDITEINLTTTTSIEEACRLLKTLKFDAMLCDQNMPEKKGLDLLKWLKREEEDGDQVVYVLYTGANPPMEVKASCEAEDIIYFIKTEQFGTLLERISERMPQPIPLRPKDPLGEFYKTVSKDLLEEMAQIESIDPTFRIYIGSTAFTPSELIKEITSRTPIGLNYLEGYFEGLKFFKK